METCRDASQIASGPFEAAGILGILGKVHLESGDYPEAVSVLEEAVRQANRYRSPQFQACFAAWLGEAYTCNGQLDNARAIVQRVQEISQEVQFPLGLALSQQALGRIARIQGAPAEAEPCLDEALRTFALIGARFEKGRTHLELAALAHAKGNREGVATHLEEAYYLFSALQAPVYVERAERLAQEFKAGIVA